MTLRAWLETMMSVGAGVSLFGGFVIWAFREKIASWVKGITKERLEKVEGRVKVLEGQMGESDKTVALIAQSIGEMTKGFERLTKTLERVDERSEETSQVVARIEGTMERRQGQR